MTLGLIETVSVAALLSGAAILATGLWRWRQTAKATSATAQAEVDLANLIRSGEERIASLVASLDASQQARIEDMRHELTSVKSDLEWLTGERMIEQAVSMARDGLSAEQISADLGVSLDAAQTISVIRRH
jgi:hypothetical protein